MNKYNATSKKDCTHKNVTTVRKVAESLLTFAHMVVYQNPGSQERTFMTGITYSTRELRNTRKGIIMGIVMRYIS